MSKPFRRWGIVMGMLLFAVLVGTFLLRSRPIRIPLADGTTLTISAITTGTLHSRPEPISWQAFRKQFATRRWGWPAESVQMPEPCVMLWIDDPKGVSDRGLTLVDRHGWRWPLSTGFGAGGNYQACFQPVETDGTARLEVSVRDPVLGTDRLVGTAVLPLPTAVPVTTPAPIPFVPPIPVTPGEPAPLPIRRTEGPLEATLRSFEIRTHEGRHAVSEGRFQLDTLWNGRPVVPEVTFLTITDRLGRREMISQPDQPFLVQFLPPREAIWDLHFRVFRHPDVPLTPEDIVEVTPKPVEGEALFQQEGTNQGRAWRVTLIPSGTASPRARFAPMSFPFQEEVPVILVEVDPKHWLRLRLETLDREGGNFPATELNGLPIPPNAFAFRSPEFDAAKGHTIRIGFDESRLVQFTVRPDEASKGRTEPQAQE